MSERIDVRLFLVGIQQAIVAVGTYCELGNLTIGSEPAQDRLAELLGQSLEVAQLWDDMAGAIRDADCNCRPATEKYEAHTCRRCELLARIGGVE